MPPLLGPAPLPPRAAKRSRALPWIMLAVGLLLGLAITIGGIAWWGWHQFVTQATAEMNEHPVVAEHIGHIRRVDVDWSTTTDEPDDDTFAFHVTGDRGNGTVIARFLTEDDDHERIDGGRLVMADGSSIDLTLDDEVSEDDAR
ncbi:hypothetical protein [Dyella sp. OK004]|uniref:hypothetical protein n=1 Tax=Dyella sp. OK004 TaxID=1855292 RepID=UPI001160DDDF|nr:hypothetical protein [Dyella sp. OK004]